mgnify:CR=1 FL=1
MAIFIAEHGDEITLLQHEADEDVGGGRDREQRVPYGHHRGGPERDDEAEIDRVPDEAIEKRRPEHRLRQE